MANKGESERRINLKFDDLDLDVLDWLNSFGKRKRARIAKAALRKAMIEGLSARELLNANVAHGSLAPHSGQEQSNWDDTVSPSGNISDAGGIPQSNGADPPKIIKEVDTKGLQSLLSLTGSEDSAEILKLI